MIRKIIHIDVEEKRNGCGLCATARHGAIDIINGKAKLVRKFLRWLWRLPAGLPHRCHHL